MNKLEPWARMLVWVFGILLAAATVIMVYSLIRPSFAGCALLILFFLYLPAAVIVASSEARNLASSGQKNHLERQEHKRIAEHPKLYVWLLLVVMGLAVVAPILHFVVRPLFSDAGEFMALFAALGAIGALLTGIALAVFAFQQWKLHRFEHSLSFTPEILLTSGGSPRIGQARENSMDYPYRIRWTVFVHNVSQLPVVIRQVELVVRPTGGHGKPAVLSPKDAHIVGADVFEVTLSRSQSIRWIAEGSTMRDLLDYASDGSGIRDFELICKASGVAPQTPDRIITKEVVSAPIYIAQDAPWGPSTPFLV